MLRETPLKKCKDMKTEEKKNLKFILLIGVALLLVAFCSGCSHRLAPTKKRFIIIANDPVTPVLAIPAALAAALPAIATAVGALGTAGINAIANRAQWNAQNEYNTPTEQMSRYRAAGLNPNLIYGTGSASAGNAGAIAPFQAQAVSTNDFLQAANAISVIKNTEANARKANAEAVGAELNNMLQSTKLQYYGTSLEYENALKKANWDYIAGKTDQLGYQNAVLQAQADKYMQDALLTKENREVFQPALISIGRTNAASAALNAKTNAGRLDWDKSAWNPLNILRSNESSIRGKELFYYDSDRLFNRRNRAFNTAVGGARTLLDFGKFFGTGSRSTYTEFDTHYSYYP